MPLFLAALRDAGLVPRAGLLIVGRMDEETRQILADPAIAPLSHAIPFSPPEKLPGLYAACDFVALPSLFEGMPNVLLEAMASGCVPIVSDAGAMGDIVGDGKTGFVFPAENRDAAARAAARAFALDDKKLAAMSKRAKELIRKEFSPEKETDALMELLFGGGKEL